MRKVAALVVELIVSADVINIEKAMTPAVCSSWGELMSVQFAVFCTCIHLLTSTVCASGLERVWGDSYFVVFVTSYDCALVLRC